MTSDIKQYFCSGRIWYKNTHFSLWFIPFRIIFPFALTVMTIKFETCVLKLWKISNSVIFNYSVGKTWVISLLLCIQFSFCLVRSGEDHWQFSPVTQPANKAVFLSDRMEIFEPWSAKFAVLSLYLHLRTIISIVAILPSLDLYFHWTSLHTCSCTIISCPQAAFLCYSGPQHALMVLHVTLSTTGKEAKCQIRFSVLLIRR